MRKSLFLLIFLFLLSFNLFAFDVNVSIFNNKNNYNESDKILALCQRYFSIMLDFDDKEKEYFINKNKSLVSFENVKIKFSLYNLQSFKDEALFLKSKLLADKILFETNGDYLLIPSSVKLDKTLIRLRLILYSRIDREYYTIYDEISSSLDADKKIDDNIVNLFSYFLKNDTGIISLPLKDYGYQAFIDGEKVYDGTSIRKGEHELKILCEGFEEYKKTIIIDALKVNDIDFELTKSKFKDLLVKTDGYRYNSFSSEIGAFSPPYLFSEYSTPSSISFSYPGFESKYISLNSEIHNINVSLKPKILSNRAIVDYDTRRFYSSVIFSLGFFALNITSKAFLNQYPDSTSLNIINNASAYAGYFSLGLLFYNLLDYYYSSLYVFK